MFECTKKAKEYINVLKTAMGRKPPYIVQQPLSGSDASASSPKCSHNEVEVWGDCTKVEPVCICKKCGLIL